MLKYLNYDIVFQEIPDEVTLAINITNCQNNCKGCHSPELQEDVGVVLDHESLTDLLSKYTNITCVCFMGGDHFNYTADSNIISSAATVKLFNPNLKTAWYTGLEKLPEGWIFPFIAFDYIKLGPYIEELGPLNNPNTNQRLYKVNKDKLEDITYKFWKN